VGWCSSGEWYLPAFNELKDLYTGWLLFLAQINTRQEIDKKTLIDLDKKFNFFKGQDAQNVFTYYPNQACLV